MGRGLSDLQKMILEHAYASHHRLQKYPNPPESDLKQDHIIQCGMGFGCDSTLNSRKAATSRAVTEKSSFCITFFRMLKGT